MAATLQQPQHPNPQLKRLVYSKYRELLGSYNDKANNIIQALPAYMVTEDKGFNFHVKNDTDEDDGGDEVDFSAPLPPTLPANGAIPARRLQTQGPIEPPACVQNAMMTKDKKPFTYTPGGIDLSQIKSPRMAKRIARNAQFEGVTNQPKPSPLAQNNQSYNSPPAAPPPASAMGLPVQVFPTGPPPPPPAPPSSSSNASNAPPPPPMASQLAPNSNGRDTRKSPTPQNFEPPPLGCRPEIKIPENPMATLRKVPKPQPKNDFWVEEYRKERSKSPLPDETSQPEESANQQVYHEAPPSSSTSPPATKQPTYNNEGEIDPRRDPNRIAFQQQRQQQQQQQPPPPPPVPQPQYQPSPQAQFQRPAQMQHQQQPQSQEPSYPPHMDPNRVAFQQQRQQQYQPVQQREVSPVRTPGGYYQQQQRQQPMTSPNVQRVDSPFKMQDNPPSMQRPMSPMRAPNTPPVQQQQQSPPSPYYTRPASQQYQPPQQQTQQYAPSPPPQQKPTQVGTLYIAPVTQENLSGNNEQPRSAGLQQTPPWLAPRQNVKDNPDWIREVNSPPTGARTQTPPINNYNQSNNGPGLRLQMTPNATQSNPRERIIPIQLEKTPTPTRTPSTPGFGPQPYSPNNQYGSVSSPGSGYSTPNPANVARHPNQFVDQGYNSFPNNQRSNQTQQQSPQQRVMSPPAQQGGARIIPIAVERDEGPFSPTSVRGPISPTPMVIQNDPRAAQQPRSPNGIAPNQSKSFRVLQKITDTDAGRESDGEQPVELHGPQYSKQMGETTDQVRKMQINEPNQQAAFVNRGDPRYRGATIPSKTFQKLKSMTDKCAEVSTNQRTATPIPTATSTDTTHQKDDDIKKWGPIQRQTQRYVQQRPIYQQDEQTQQYVHPSEQQVQEPKIYTGSAIPSRSFKLLQAMTTPENAVKTEDTRIVVENAPKICPPCYGTPYPGSRRSLSPILKNPIRQSRQENNQFYHPYAHYYPQYDIQQLNGHMINGVVNDDQYLKPIEGAPDIVITTSPDDDDNHDYANINGKTLLPICNNEISSKENSYALTNKFKRDTLPLKNKEEPLWNDEVKESIYDVVTKRLNEMTSPIYDEQANAKVVNSFENPCESNTKLSNNEKFRKNSEESDDESDDLATTSSSSSGNGGNEKIHSSTEGLHAIKSVTDIKVYDNDDDENIEKDDKFNQKYIRNQCQNYVDDHYGFKIAPEHRMWFEDDSEENCHANGFYKVDEEEGIVDTDSNSDGEDHRCHDDVEIRDQLSVIYEEDDTQSDMHQKRRTESMNSTSSTISECSTTIANDELSKDDEGNRTEDDEDALNDDEEENSVTVRLPLRLSFSKSSNDENITTVVVGDSEIRDSRRSSLISMDDNGTTNILTDRESSERKQKYSRYDNDENDQGNDISVTISLTSRSNSVDRSGLLSKTPSVDRETSAKDWDDSDSESVSVSVSLPMKRNKFMTQTLNDGLTNDIHGMQFNWDRRESEEDDRTDGDDDNETRREDTTIKEIIPETIVEEVEEHENQSTVDEKSEHEFANPKEQPETILFHSKLEVDETKLSVENKPKKEYSVEVKIDMSPMYPQPYKLPESEQLDIPDKFDALRELRKLTESAVRRATLEREQEQKMERPKLSLDLSFDNLPNFCDQFWSSSKSKESQNKCESDESDTDTDTSTSSEQCSSESDKLGRCVEETRTDQQENAEAPKMNPINESMSFVLEETRRRYEEAMKKFDEQLAVSEIKTDRKEEPTKLSVRERIAAFEIPRESLERSMTPKPIIMEIANNNTLAKKEILSRNSSVQRSESEQEEDDSGVTSDMSKPQSENDTDPECFPELKRMSRYQRASTHSRLFKLLQEEMNGTNEQKDKEEVEEDKEAKEEDQPRVVLRPKKKIVHNVSITRRSNPEALKEAESMSQRRERLSLPLKMSNSIDADNPSTSNSPSSPGVQNEPNEQLVTELVQSLLLKKDNHHLRNIPWSKLQAAATKVLQDGFDVDSLENTSIESTPALTPQDSKKEYQKSYSDYYDSWDRSTSPRVSTENSDISIIPSPTFRSLNNQSPFRSIQNQSPFRSLHNQSPLVFSPVRCPRVLSSKTLNRDLSRLTETRESQSPDNYSSPRGSVTPEISRDYVRGTSLTRIGKV